MQMQCYAACGDDDVRAVVQRRYGELYRWVEEVTGADELAMHQFFSTGMLMNVAAAIDLPASPSRGSPNCLGALRRALSRSFFPAQVSDHLQSLGGGTMTQEAHMQSGRS